MATWQHLRSSTANKRPTTSLADGRIAINTNTASPGLFFKDSAGTGIVKVGPVHVGTTAPNSVPAAGGSSGNYTGEQWLDTSVSPAQMKVWNGSTWVGIVADELPVSKLQDGAARQLIQTDAAGTGVEWTSDVDVPGTLDVTSTATFDSIAQHPLGTAGAPTITFTGDNNTGIYSPGADQVAISTGGTGRLFINSGGVVDISNTTIDKFTLSHPGFGIGTIGSDSTGSLLFKADEANTQANSLMQFKLDGSERMRLTSTGLGVGTSSPSEVLTVAGNIRVNNSNPTLGLYGANGTSPQVIFGNSAGTAHYSIYETTDPSTGTRGSLNIYDVVAAANRVTVDTSGRLGVGTTSASSLLSLGTSLANYKLKLYDGGDSNDYGFGVQAGVLYYQSGGAHLFNVGGTERARIDSSGRVGIGTSAPGTILDVAPDANRNFQVQAKGGTTYGLEIKNGTANSGGEFHVTAASSGAVVINRGSTEIARFNSAGLGIGTTSPTSKLQVDSGASANVDTVLVAGASSLFSYAYSSAATGASFYGLSNANTTGIQSFGSAITFGTYAAQPVIFGTSNAERARIDSSGRLLVGTSSARGPGDHIGRLQVEGTGYATSTISIFANSNDAFGSYLFLGKSRGTAVGSNTIVQSGDSIGQIRFSGTDGTGAISGAIIESFVDGTPGANDMPGRLVFSVTQDGQASPTGRFWIINNGYSYFQSTGQGIAFATTQGAGTTYETILAGHSATNGTFNSINTSFRVFSNGNVQNTNNSYGAISDLKLKENIVNANPQWDDIKALQVRNYNFKEGQTHTQIGLVAQEVELVSPGLVTESPDRDAEGNDLGTVTKSVNYSVLYMKAVKALQEAMERIEQLEQRLTDAGIA